MLGAGRAKVAAGLGFCFRPWRTRRRHAEIFARGGGNRQSTELGQAEVRVYGATAVLTAESQAVSSRNGVESRSHFRLIAVYVCQGQSIKLVHFQSTVVRQGALNGNLENRRLRPKCCDHCNFLESDF